MSGVRLELTDPGIARRDCEHCQKYFYDEDKGLPILQPGGQPMPRPPGNLAPCRITGIGCPKGTPEEQRALTPQNRECFQHYQECRAVGQFPDDPIVKRNAALIREVTDAVDRERWADFRMGVLNILAARTGV